MKESELQREVIKCLESVGVWTFNVHGHGWQKSGVPDLYCAHPKWTGWIEFKVGEGKPSALQIICMKDLLLRGVAAFVVREMDGVIYCELWGGGKHCETLSFCKDWSRSKGIERGKQILEMLVGAGRMALEIMKSRMKE